MSAYVLPVLGAADPAANPTTLVELVNYLNTLFLQVDVQNGPFTPYVISSTTPAVGDNDKAWLQVDGNGRPLATKLFYNGAWHKIYTGKIGEIAIFSGDPSIYFDNTGLGLSTAAEPNWDGWALCNSQNGTPNLSNKFIIGGAMDNAGITGYSGGHWNTNVTGGATQTGGAGSYAIQNTDLPSMKVFVTGLRYSSGAATGVKRVLVDGDHATSPENTDLNPIASFGADPSGTPPVQQTSVPTVPPYYSLAFAQFKGYA